MIEVDFIVEKCEMRSDIHEITAETEKPFQDHFWKDHFCDPGIAFVKKKKMYLLIILKKESKLP